MKVTIEFDPSDKKDLNILQKILGINETVVGVEKPDRKIKIDIQKAKKTSQEIKTKWSRRFDACRDCGTTDRAHLARGYCGKCYWKHPIEKTPYKSMKRGSPAANSKKSISEYYEGFDDIETPKKVNRSFNSHNEDNLIPCAYENCPSLQKTFLKKNMFERNGKYYDSKSCRNADNPRDNTHDHLTPLK